ncbi:hypothetical protein HKX48_006357 [Thoreauomyces humboldtii]|nr:hypothetical protein HKX48_006357 [Thoreauomyces humboldtii]
MPLVLPPLLPAKRAEQNRAAQRAFRERKQRYIKELEVKATLLDSRHGQLAESEARHRELRTMVERLTRERDVRIKERELWWREREEVFRVVEGLRKDLDQLHGGNDRLKEVVFGLWQESRENGDADGEASVAPEVISEMVSSKTDAAAPVEAVDLSGEITADALAAAPPPHKTNASIPLRDPSAPSLGTIPFARLLEGGSNGSGPALASVVSPPTATNNVSDQVFVKLRDRIGYWDAEREALYRNATFPPASSVSNAHAQQQQQAGSVEIIQQQPSQPLPAIPPTSAAFMDYLFSTLLASGNGVAAAQAQLQALVNDPAALSAAFAASAKAQQLQQQQAQSQAGPQGSAVRRSGEEAAATASAAPVNASSKEPTP